jgi:surface protein
MLGDAPFALTAPQSNSDGAFTYSSSHPSVATVSGSTVTIIGTGTTTITATQAATTTYGSNSITASLVVTPPILSLSGVTIAYTGNAADVPTNAARFIQANPRGTGPEWFAVVKDGMKTAISAYANGTNTPFIPSGQSVPVPFNNIVTTLMTDIKQLFYSNYTINEPISSWDTANVTDMSEMFVYATAFNQPIGSWNTDKVTNMSYMFYNAHAFNQPIGSWNTANVTNMGSMFEYAYAFNQNISNWNVALVTIYTIFRQNSALSDENTPSKFR